ncbi:MAG: universal stress protein UspA [Syntrophobacterales bacterium CG_4_9_14_3_um_filter_49_8]|nr:MAG: universal stress protein UspA [Syntrophobacterales bacterium CG_4_9_14_3_um_filter_49_8]
MERILVIVNNKNYSWEALGRAVSLAKRINAKVFVLKIFSPQEKEIGAIEQDMKTSAGRRLENIIQTARADSIKIEHFVTEGAFKEEVIRFVEHNKISILVVEPGSWETKSSENLEKGLGPIQEILYRISCRVEMVSQKKSY